MNKIFLKLALIASLISPSFAAKFFLAPTPAAKVFYINLSTKNCDSSCLYELLYEGQYLSFLALANDAGTDEKLQNYQAKLLNGLDYLSFSKRGALRQPKIAVVVAQDAIKSYTSNVVSPPLALLINSKNDAKLRVFYTGKMHADAQLLSKLQEYDLIVAGFLGEPLAELAAAVAPTPVYAPLEAAANLPEAGQNLRFGAIDYEEQVAALLRVAAPRVGVFQDASALSRRISQAVENAASVGFKATIDAKDYNVNKALAGAHHLNGASVFFNVALVKTTLLATQLHAMGIRAKNYLSTQINYHPMFLNLAQDYEKERFYFASIIGKIDPNIEYLNELLGQKIAYNWIAYSTSSGLDALLHRRAGWPRAFSENFEGAQLIFSNKVMSSANSKFTEIQ